MSAELPYDFRSHSALTAEPSMVLLSNTSPPSDILLAALNRSELAACVDYINNDCADLFVMKHGYEMFFRCKNYLEVREALNQPYDYEEYEKTELAWFVIYGCMLNVICLAGIIGNILSFYVMRAREFSRSTTTIYLQVLMVVDSMLLVANYAHYVLITGLDLGRWYITPWPAYIRAYVQYNLVDLLRNCSTLLTVAVTVERYIFVCHSLHAAKICTSRKSRAIVIIAMLIALIYEAPRFFMHKVESINLSSDPNCTLTYSVTPTSDIPALVEEVISYIGNIAFVLLPMAVLSVLTCMLLSALRQSRLFRQKTTMQSEAHLRRSQSAESSTTVMLVAVVITFVVCNLPNSLIVVSRYAGVWDRISPTLEGTLCFCIATLLLNINSAINVVLFCFFGSKFRRLFLAIFVKCKCSLRQRQSYQQVNQLPN